MPYLRGNHFKWEQKNKLLQYCFSHLLIYHNHQKWKPSSPHELPSRWWVDQQEWWQTVQLCRRSLLRWRSPWRRRWTVLFISVPALLEHNVLHALKQWLVQENKFAAPELQLTSFRDEEVGFFLHFINGQALSSHWTIGEKRNGRRGWVYWGESDQPSQGTPYRDVKFCPHLPG